MLMAKTCLDHSYDSLLIFLYYNFQSKKIKIVNHFQLLQFVNHHDLHP